ncbi:E3 ubiquitin-protein ligase TRIM35-like isoform X2 [Gadus macrocephalus]|uniref:E3 ubiquitin-protein ligase TRIM35-like isoform X2 n=1 Tax=Gadus macrocephalus TaxID=80720 RepID=UPI0028CBAE5B|nr:E3 ubiquitin-protein ligase TRIM35-like isoform X2 [Gadus macrocephalus]
MATSSSHPKEDCLCPVCRDLYRDPILLMCGHSFCRNCIQEWRTQKGSKTCPVCKKMCSLDLPPRNLALKNLTDCLREEASRQTAEDLCETHGEKLKLFCVDHQKPICVICRDAKDHKKHQCVPINEAAEDNKKQAEQTEENIKGEFKKLDQFLRAEEAARIDGLRKEADKKSQAMQIRRANLFAETSSISKTVKAAEKDLEAADLSYMINYEAIKKRAQCTLPDPETPSGALIDEAKHRGNLLFHVWKKMKSIIQYTSFLLDPNTAKSNMIVSENLMSLTMNNKKREVPSNPERCFGHAHVLGSTGISSGIHFWDVHLGDNCEVGVITKTKEETRASLFVHDSLVVGQHSPENEDYPIVVDHFPKNIRVQFEHDKGTLLFYDLDTKKYLHTITHKFTGVYFPFFRGDVKLIPQCSPLV